MYIPHTLHKHLPQIQFDAQSGGGQLHSATRRTAWGVVQNGLVRHATSNAIKKELDAIAIVCGKTTKQQTLAILFRFVSN